MKSANAKLFSPLYTLILLAAAFSLAVAIACSTANKPKAVAVGPSQPIGPLVRPEAPKTVAFTASKPETVTVADKGSSRNRTTPPKFIGFKSRDYGVSFQYPWQYTKISAKTIASDATLQPQPDGFEGQVTLARVDVPKGFYPDTDFDSGYFTLSLNQDMSKEDCESSLKTEREKLQTLSINGVDFRWIEVDRGGKGTASKIRNYVTYANDTCYEVETGVKTSNDGLSREVDPDQVLRRLDGVLMSIKIIDSQLPARQQLQSTNQPQSPEQGK